MFNLFKRKSPLAKALRQWIAGEAAFDTSQAEAGITTPDEATAVAEALAHADAGFARCRADLHPLIGLLQNVGSAREARMLHDRAFPPLLAIVRRLKASGDGADDGLFALKQVALYGHRDGLRELAEVLREGLWADSYMWSVIFDALARHPQAAGGLVTALDQRLPEGFASVAYLDLVNTLCREHGLQPHPFDRPPGHARLAGYLRDAANPSHGVSAAAALPFCTGAGQVELMAMALAHGDADVRMEAAWAAARLGDVRGLDHLVQQAGDPITAAKAIRYLEELGAQERIPAAAADAGFAAMAQMAEWLAHPQEFGRPPAAVELMDRRALRWPPTGQAIDAFLVRYRYAKEEGGEDIGVGMVGSVTFALFGESTAERSAEDIYGLHCIWEMQQRNDPRAPEQRTAGAGRALLEAENPGKGF